MKVPVKFCLALWLILASPVAMAGDLRILMYHRVGEDRYPSTSVTVAQFDAHITAIKQSSAQVLPLSEAITRWRSGTLPPKALTITFDDAYRSAFTEAAPRLKAAGLPFTVFVATRAHNQGYGEMMSWDDIRRLPEFGGSVAAHGHTHGSFAFLSEHQIDAELAAMTASFQSELGSVPDLLAFPYGETSQTALRRVKQAGFIAAFGQHSGVVGSTSPADYLPRFTLNERYGTEDRFDLILRTRALPLQVDAPVDSAQPASWDGRVILKTSSGNELPHGLTCYAGGTGAALKMQKTAETLMISIPKQARTGRVRLNCTAPDGQGSVYWFGHLITMQAR